MAYRGALGLAAMVAVTGGIIMAWQRVPDRFQRGLKAAVGIIFSLLLLATMVTNLSRCTAYFAG